MNTSIQLPDKAAAAVNDLQARKTALQAIVKHRNFPCEDKSPVYCDNVPAGLGDGTSLICEAIHEIDATIAMIIQRALVDRSF
jgi:hypothetical protein